MTGGNEQASKSYPAVVHQLAVTIEFLLCCLYDNFNLGYSTNSHNDKFTYHLH